MVVVLKEKSQNVLKEHRLESVRFVKKTIIKACENYKFCEFYNSTIFERFHTL